VALAVEASLQQYLPPNDALFYILCFLCVVLYYNMAYITEKPSAGLNPRTRWYARNLGALKRLDWILSVCFVAAVAVFLFRYGVSLLTMPLWLWGMMLSFPLAGVLYYGINHRSVGRFTLRDVGWLKPFIIGFSWAGLVTVAPVVYYSLSRDVSFPVSAITVVLFIKNFMFISLLCILFDIKDYATDYNQQLKTFVVEMGLRKTIFLIIIPLTVVGLGSFLLYGAISGFTLGRILLNTIPFFALIAVAYSLYRRRSIFYYLVIIDGLMLVKALCGISAMLLFGK